jgi:hypothetical protein
MREIMLTITLPYHLKLEWIEKLQRQLIDLNPIKKYSSLGFHQQSAGFAQTLSTIAKLS